MYVIALMNNKTGHVNSVLRWKSHGLVMTPLERDSTLLNLVTIADYEEAKAEAEDMQKNFSSVIKAVSMDSLDFDRTQMVRTKELLEEAKKRASRIVQVQTRWKQGMRPTDRCTGPGTIAQAAIDDAEGVVALLEEIEREIVRSHGL